jgi:hypothetical protein
LVEEMGMACGKEKTGINGIRTKNYEKKKKVKVKSKRSTESNINFKCQGLNLESV